jgi:hypothetical protein
MLLYRESRFITLYNEILYLVNSNNNNNNLQILHQNIFFLLTVSKKLTTGKRVNSGLDCMTLKITVKRSFEKSVDLY